MARSRRSPAGLALVALAAWAAAAAPAGWRSAFAAPPPGAPLGRRAPGARARLGAAAAAAEVPEAYSVGGPRAQAVLTAAVAGVSIYLLSIANEATRLAYGVGHLWAPPLGAAALIFAQAATTAAGKGTLWSPGPVVTQASQLAVALGGSCTIAVLLSKLLGPSALTRALAVASCSLWMAAVPVSAYFPPVGAFCVLYVDQVMAKGPLATLVHKYALFPCVAGTLFLVVATRLLTLGVAPLLRRLQK